MEREFTSAFESAGPPGNQFHAPTPLEPTARSGSPRRPRFRLKAVAIAGTGVVGMGSIGLSG